MKNFITYLSKKSLSLGNGSGMTRKRLGIDSGMTRFSLASLICLCMLTVGVGNAWADTVVYSTGFESTTTDTNYKGTVTCTSAEGNGATWSIYYGNFTTNAPITGSKCAQLRLYSDKNCGTMTQTSDISNVDSVRFAYKCDNTNVRFKVQYSTNSGSSWTDWETGLGGNTSATGYFKKKLATRASKFRLKIIITGGHPTSSSRKLIIDDIVYKTVSSCSSPGSALSVSASPTTIFTSGSSALSTGGGNGSDITYTVTSANSSDASIVGTTFTATRPGTYTVQASQDDDGGTCGGTATVDITVRYQVKWSVNGNDSYTTGSPTTYIGTHNTKVSTLPTDPGKALCDGSKEFVGWTATPIVGTTNTIPTDLFTTAAGAPNVTNNVTYYAVFATVGTATFQASDITNTPATENSLEWEHTASGTLLKLSAGQRYTDGTPNTWTVTKGTSNYARFTAGSGKTITKIVVTISGTDHKINSVTKGTLSTSSTTQTITGINNSTTDCKATSSYQIRITQAVVTYASAFATSCCTALGTINGSVSWTTHNTARVTWSIPTDASSNKKIAGVKLYLYADNAGAKGDAISNTGSTYSSDNTTTYHEFSGLDPETKYWFTIEAFGRTAGGVTYCDAPEGTPVSFITQPACDDFSFHCGTDGGSDWSVYCFEQVSTTHEWHIENFTIPSTPDLYVGKQNDFKDGSDGYLNSPENAVSNTVAWADAPTKSSSLWQGQIHLVPYNTSSNDLENWGVGLATGATGTVNIYDNSSDKNLFVGFEPDGYGIVYGGNSYAFGDATDHVRETEVVTLPADLSATYYVGLKTSSSYVKCAHSATTDPALSTMGHTSKEGGLRKIWLYSTADSWIGSSAKMAIWDATNSHWGNNTSDTKFMTKVNNNLWYGYVPTSATTIILVRVNPSNSDPAWDWGQSYNVQPSDVNNYVTITGTWSEDSGDSNKSKAEYTLTSYHPSASQKGKFRMWDNNSLKNWCTHFVPHYKLTYNANGGSNAPAAVYGNSEETDNVTINNGNGLTPPTGKHFVKWNTANDGSGEDVAAGSYTLTEDLEIFAIYDWDYYTVTVNKSGCASATVGADKTTSVHYGETVTLSADEPAGYAFVNWTTSDGVTFSPNATTKGATFTMPASNVTVQANYHQIYTITWKVNNVALTGDALDGADVNVEQGSNLSGVPSTAPADNSLNNCANKFMGWSKKSAGSTPKTTSYYDDLFTSASEFVDGGGTITENTTFYAVFAESAESGTYSDGTTHVWSYSPGFDDWGGSTTHQWTRNKCGTIPTHEYTPDYGVKKVVLNVKQTQDKTGASNTVAVTVGGTAIGSTQTMGSGSGTSYYNMTFDNGTGTPLTGKVRIVVTNTSTDPSCNTTGLGSYDLSSITLYEGSPDITYINFVTQCADNQVRVTYDANGGRDLGCTSGVTTKNASYTVCSTEPTRNYYEFSGWNDGTSTYDAGDSYNLSANTTFTAQWTPTTYNISYELDGGTNNVGNPATYNVTTATITLQDPTKGHDRFEGWFKTYSAGVYSDQVTSIPLGSHGDITLYAKWTERHEIVFDADGATTTIYRADDENMEDAVAGQGSVPSDPDAPTACSSKVFMGWSESTIDGETDTEPGDLMKPAAGTVNADKHYYAVWATESSSSGTVTVFEDDMNISGTAAVGSREGWVNSQFLAANGADGSIKLSSGSNGGRMQTEALTKAASTNTISFKIKMYSGDTEGTVSLSASKGSLSTSDFSTTDAVNWTTKTTTLSSADETTQITFTGTKDERIYIKDILITKTGTVYTYDKYATSCCATKITLSDPSITDAASSGATITFNKGTTVGTCGGSKEVEATLTLPAGYQATNLSFSVNSGTVSISPAISTPVNTTTTYTLTFAEDQNATLTTTATIAAKPLSSITLAETEVTIYDQQYVQIGVTYDPADILTKGYTLVSSPTKVVTTGSTQTQFKISATKAGVVISSETKETVSIKANADNTKTASVEVTILPLPKVHFADNVHNESFSDVVATIEDNALSATKSTPTSDDFVGSTANACEETHLHLVGWIDGDWTPYANYMAGTGSMPDAATIIGATGYFYAPGADIDTSAKDGKTYYAIWAEIK